MVNTLVHTHIKPLVFLACRSGERIVAYSCFSDHKTLIKRPILLLFQVQCAGLHLEQRHALRLGGHRVPGDVRGGGRGLRGARPPLHDHRILCQEAAPPQE